MSAEFLGTLYHWSPAERHKSIIHHGLVPGSPSNVASGELAFVCLSPRPSQAWALSGAMEWAQEIEEWDLWQVQIPDEAEIHIRPFFGRLVEEIKCYTTIPPSNLWFVGTRTN
jgi:hypothetical protein